MPQFQNRITLNASAAVDPAGQFEILAITQGDGNGWQFSAEVLQASLELWDGAECFIDHAFFGHSVRDLAGVLFAPAWDDQELGITCKLKAIGPSASLLEELGRQVLAEDDPKPAVGFSADIAFTSTGKDVKQNLRVFSVDLVMDPARGGAFKRALNSIHSEVNNMPQPTNPAPLENPQENQAQLSLPSVDPPPVQPNPSAADQLNEDQKAVRALLDEQARQQALADEATKARAVRAQMCEYLLDSALSAAGLPAPAAERVRKQFAGSVFEPAQLQEAIEDARTFVSQLTAGAVVQGPGRINGMFNTADKLQAAVDDMLDAPRDKDAASLEVAKLSGVRELYMMLTGDYDLHGGFRSDRVQLATTSDFTGLVKNALNKIVANRWEELGRAGYDWWNKIVTIEHFSSLNTITGTLIGTVGSLPSVSEGAEYTELAIGDSPETADFTKYGGYIPLTLELIDRDETRKLKAYPRELASAGLRKISALVAAIFTANSDIGPTMADTGALFNATAVTTAGGHGNLLTTALSASQWDTVSKAVYEQPMLIKNASGYYGTGPAMAINPRYLCVPRELMLTGKKILYPSLENAANIYSENQQQGSPVDVVVVPEWTDANNWAAVCDPVIAPAIFVGDRFGLMPEIYIAGQELSPAVFMNDEHRLKVRHFLAVWVNDFRPLHKSNVA